MGQRKEEQITEKEQKNRYMINSYRRGNNT